MTIKNDVSLNTCYLINGFETTNYTIGLIYGYTMTHRTVEVINRKGAGRGTKNVVPITNDTTGYGNNDNFAG